MLLLALAVPVTVLAELQKRETSAPRDLVAFGDPEGWGADPAEAAFQVALRTGTALDPLPGSRREAKALRRAQIDLLRGDSQASAVTTHPFYWAAFQVHGAWE